MFKVNPQSGMVSEVYLRSQLIALWNAMEPCDLATEYQRGWLEAMRRIGMALGLAWVDTLPAVGMPSTNEVTNPGEGAGRTGTRMVGGGER